MGGRAFETTQPILIDKLYLFWPKMYEDLVSLGCENIQTTGSTFHKHITGDIDVACEGNYERIFNQAILEFGQEGVRKIGKHTISICWNRWAQIDIIVGNSKLTVWTHYGPSNIPGVSHSSQFKGTIRHILMSAILYEKSCQHFGHHNNNDYRTCYQFDIEEGIFEIFQTKIGIRNNKLKKWKTLNKKLLYWTPQEICDFIFKDFSNFQISYNDVYTFEELFSLLQEMRKYSYVMCKDQMEKSYQQIIDSFLRDIEINIKEKPLRIASSQEEAYKVLEQLKNIINN
jgi:hypothetical protein